MALTFADVLAQLSLQAQTSNEPFVAHLCRLAAVAADGKDIPVPQTGMVIVGMWDWDTVKDVNHLDEGCADLFGVDPDEARRGMSINDYLKVIHPDDAARLGEAIMQTLKYGGPIEIRYRVVYKGRIRHVLARGVCTLDEHGRAQRFPGVILEFPSQLS
jgi:PAS domain-containing protein